MAVDRKQQMKEITERLEQGVKDIFTSEMYTTYLRTMAKFHNYSFNNTLLIAMQRPDATLVAGFNAWKNKFNRYVKKGEKGIQIIAPAPIKEVEEREKINKDTGLAVLNENGEPEMERVEYVIPRFRVTTVFDVSQTDGEPIPSLEVNELTASVKDYALLTAAIEQVSPVPMRFDEIEGDAKGYYSDADKEICIQVGMGESQTIKTMIHEVAHAMLHNSDFMKQHGEEKDRLTKETEAESIAFTVCSALGIDTSDYSFPYVASWASGKEMKELKDSMDTIRLTAADFLEKLEAAVAERSAERMTAMQYAEKLIADKEQVKTIFDDEQRDLIVNFAYKLDDQSATEKLVNALAAAMVLGNKEEANRLMYEAQEKIENLPDRMIGLSEMHDYGYRKDDMLPLKKEGAREWHRLGERIYPLFQDGTAGDFASQEEIEQHDGIFGIKADAWSAILLEKNEEYLEDEYARPDAALTVISREQALRLFDEGKQIYLIRISPWPVLVTEREEIERGSDYFQIAKEDLEKDKQKAMENSEKAPVEKLAADLDDFAFDFDFYHYKDSVEDREQAVEVLKEQIQAGDIQPIREWLQVAVEESEGESAEKAAELITRLDALVKEQKLLSGSEKQFGIYQITARDQEHDYRFMNLDFVKRHGMEVNRADYELVYTAPLTEKDTLEAIYERFNIQRPADFTGHSLSVSDVVVLNDGKSIKACYVDSIGFAELPDFFKERNMDLQKDDAKDYSDVPVYYEPFDYAKEHDEVDLYRTSSRINSECKQAIQKTIADNYDGMYLGNDAVNQVVKQYGMERVGYILANTLHHKIFDGRFSRRNKEWAEQVSTPEHNADRMTFRTDWVVDSHPAILDGFVTMYRDELEAQKRQEQPFVKQFYVVENLQAAPLKIERFGNLDDAMSQYQALPNHYMKALGVEKNPNPLPGSLDILQCKNGLDTIVEDYKTVPGWDNPYIQNHVVHPLQGALAVQDVELAYELSDVYFHIQTCEDGFDYTLYNKDFTERDGGILETDGDKSVREAMTELLAEFGCDAAQGKVMNAAELREQADTIAEQQAEALKEKLAAERPAPVESISFYVAECSEFTFAGEYHDHLTMEQALEIYDKIPSERMNGVKCIGFCIEEDGGFVGMYELLVGDKVQRENINAINYFRDDKLVQQAISDMEKLMAERQKNRKMEDRSNTRKSVLDALHSLKAKKQEQPAQEQDKPKKAKSKGMEL